MSYFVTGTDTGVGKTHVTAALVRALRGAGRTANAVKPIETGWNPPTSDAARLATASGRSVDQTVFLRFAQPRSPSSAAAAEDRLIDLAAVIGWCRQQPGDPLFVEGAGGWMVPIRGPQRMRDLAAGLSAPVVVVGRAGLGAINHGILTIEAVAQTATVAGAILSRRPDDDLDFARDNAREIAAQTGARVALIPDDLDQILTWFAAGPVSSPAAR